MIFRRQVRAVLTLVVPVALTMTACGGSGDVSTSSDPSPPRSTSTSSNSTSSTVSTSEPFVPTTSPSFADIPADYQPPSGWIRVDDDTVDLRLDAFAYREEGCCEAGLDADFGSPELPASGAWEDIEDGLYYAGLTGWDPTRPDVIQMAFGRVVECASPEGSGSPYCNDEVGRFEYLQPFTPFEVPLGAFLTVRLGTYLEPTPDDFDNGFALSYASYLGQGPDFAALLTALHQDYSNFIADPTSEGSTIGDIAGSLLNSPFRHVGASNGVWERPNFPPFSYWVRQLIRFDSSSPFTAVPACYDDAENPICLPNVSGDPEGAPATFEYLILNAGSVHVRDGRWAFFYPGVYTAGG